MQRTALVAALLASACAGAPPKPAAGPTAPAATAETASGAAAPDATAAAPATPSEPPTATAEAPTEPGAKVLGLTPRGDDKLVKILFSNPTSHVCTFSAYTLTWPGGTKRIDAKPFHVPAGSERRRSLRVHKDDGDVTTLDKGSANVEVEADCGGS